MNDLRRLETGYSAAASFHTCSLIHDSIADSGVRCVFLKKSVVGAHRKPVGF